MLGHHDMEGGSGATRSHTRAAPSGRKLQLTARSKGTLLSASHRTSPLSYPQADIVKANTLHDFHPLRRRQNHVLVLLRHAACTGPVFQHYRRSPDGGPTESRSCEHRTCTIRHRSRSLGYGSRTHDVRSDASECQAICGT